MSPAEPSSAALANATAAGQHPLRPQNLGVVVPINPIGVPDRQLLDLDRLGAGAVQHAQALAAARLPLTDQACARMAQLEWGRQALREHERQQHEADLLHALTTCHAQIEQQALAAEPLALTDAPQATALPTPAAQADPTTAGLADTAPTFSPRALRHEHTQTSHRHPLRSDLSNERARAVIGLVLAGLLIAMEASLVSQFNPVLLPTADPTVERDWLAHLVQVLAALLLVTMLGAARLLAVQAGTPGRPAAQRVATGLGAGITAASACLMAAIVTWPAFGPLVEALLSGQSAASGMALEGGAVATPLWLRLLTAPALLAIGLMAGQMLQMATDGARQVRLIKPRLAELDADLALFKQARSLGSAWVHCRGQRLAPAQVQRHVDEACTDGFEAYLTGLQRHRLPAVAPHRESAADRLHRQASDQQIEALARTAAQVFSAFTPIAAAADNDVAPPAPAAAVRDPEATAARSDAVWPAPGMAILRADTHGVPPAPGRNGKAPARATQPRQP